MLVANHYDLNPLTREIFAYPKRGGGIVPVVSVDGWVNLINRQPNCDGWNMVAEHGQNGALVSYTCTMHRKDRAHPVEVTEYLSECFRDTEAWKMKHRMLRHKALIQAGRYAFGFAGIYDEDEGRAIAGIDDARETRRPPAPSGPPITVIEHKPAIAMATVNEEAARGDATFDNGRDYPKREGEPLATATASPRRPPPPPSAKPAPAPKAPVLDFVAFRAALDAAPTLDAANGIYAEWIENRRTPPHPDELDEADAIMRDVGSRFSMDEA
jgi:hypothetical protein